MSKNIPSVSESNFPQKATLSSAPVISEKVVKNVYDGSYIQTEDEVDFSDLKINIHSYTRLGLFILLFTFGILGVWAGVAPISGATSAQGTVTVQSATKEVQHLEGGIIEKIFVQEGDKVKIGQPLLKLNDINAQANFSVLKLQSFENMALIARLRAQLNNAAIINFPEQLLAIDDKERLKEITKNQFSIFSSVKNSHDKEIKILESTGKQIKQQIIGLKKQLNAERKRISYYKEEIREREKLFRMKLDSKIVVREMQREKLELDSIIASHESEIAKSKILIGENESKIILQEQKYQSETLTALDEALAKEVDLKVKLIALKDTLNRMLVKAPENGVIVGLKVDTVGAVIQAGEEICQIVPQSNEFTIIAKVNTIDIDKVHLGLKVDIRFNAFNTRFTQIINGEVIHVSANILEDEKTSDPYYETKIIVTEEGDKVVTENNFELVPGMPVTVLIKTGQRTVLSYLFRPFKDMLANAFND